MQKTNSTTITNGIKIHVVPNHLIREGIEDDDVNYFSYKIEIVNVGDNWAKLLRRYWKIIDANGVETEIEGAGVIGFCPEIAPGGSFVYTSYCPLATEWGTMEGYYEMTRMNGEKFLAKIDRFYLISTKLLEEKE